ncbi:hypothetical protein PoB_000367300 [Plakobranchus ocellatus]|uniref:Uncharacterized protein n=1 Tax=Plakobranchus ocellatus TaxID=259542 RepID=A0AAV3Y4P9_9GAST|nr:hypothetical protein PoB_000367300 [Plakobranchus ocellatus]
MTGLVVRAATVTRIMRGHVMAVPFPLSDRASDVRPGCKTQRTAPTLRQVADLMCSRLVTAHTGGSSLGLQRCNNQHVWKRYNNFTNSAHYVGYDTDT